MLPVLHSAADDYSTRSLLSEVGKWMVPSWGVIIILYEVELAQLKTTPRKPLIRDQLLAQSGLFWWGILWHAKKSKITSTSFVQIEFCCRGMDIAPDRKWWNDTTPWQRRVSVLSSNRTLILKELISDISALKCQRTWLNLTWIKLKNITFTSQHQCFDWEKPSSRNHILCA